MYILMTICGNLVWKGGRGLILERERERGEERRERETERKERHLLIYYTSKKLP